jgi:hypothetical protein
MAPGSGCRAQERPLSVLRREIAEVPDAPPPATSQTKDDGQSIVYKRLVPDKGSATQVAPPSEVAVASPAEPEGLVPTAWHTKLEAHETE